MYTGGNIEEGHGHDRMKLECHLDLSLIQSYYKKMIENSSNWEEILDSM